MSKERRWVVGIIGFLTILYPLGVYFGIQYFEPWVIAIGLSVLLVLKLIIAPADKQWSQCLLLAGFCFFLFIY